jgi:hypothetical protein
VWRQLTLARELTLVWCCSQHPTHPCGLHQLHQAHCHKPPNRQSQELSAGIVCRSRGPAWRALGCRGPARQVMPVGLGELHQALCAGTLCL